MSTLRVSVGFLVPFLALSQHCADSISHLQTHKVSTGGVDGQLRLDGSLTEPNDYYECTDSADCPFVNVRNVGAACCSGDNTCMAATIILAAGGTCTHDVCCSGQGSCSDLQLPADSFVSSLSCNGISACARARTTLSQDLFCSGNTACFQATFNFEAGEQCIVCDETLACTQATFNVANSGDVTNALCTGEQACKDSAWTVASGKQMRLYCQGESSCPSSSVTLQSGSALRLFCDGDSACQSTTITKQSRAKCQCTELNNGVCPDGCRDSVSIDPPTRCVSGEDTACCAGEGQCADCGCGETTTATTSGEAVGGAVGDPHMDTLDGKHYMLLRQGTFSLWRFTGMDAEVGVGHGHRKMPVDFQIYAHYSGHTSYTKGLLLLDSSGGKGPRMALEMTAQDCRWRYKTQGAWNAVNGHQLLSLPDVDGDNMTAFKVVESGAKTQIELLMKEVTGFFTKIGKLFVRCKPGHFLNVKMSMPKQDVHLVEGQLGPREGDGSKLGASSFVQGTQEVGRRDQEFETSKSWEDLGGSSVSASYLRLVDGQGVAFSGSCGKGEEEKAKVECAKYLGKASTSGSSQFDAAFASCIYDVCHGGGEIAAQLAAEIWNAK